jgi:hypothetical protein
VPETRAAPARKKTTVKETTTRKETTARKKAKGAHKKSTRKKSTRKYGPGASDQVHRELHEMEKGRLRSGRSDKKVTSRKQAIAIGLSEARRQGDEVPSRRKRST